MTVELFHEMMYYVDITWIEGTIMSLVNGTLDIDNRLMFSIRFTDL